MTENSISFEAYQPEFDPGIRELMAASPEKGVVHVGYQLHATPETLGPRFSERVAYCAMASDGRVAGMLVTDFQEVRFAGAVRMGGYFRGLRCHPDFRRHRVALRMTKFAEQKAIERGAEVVWTCVAGGNEAPARLAEKAGLHLMAEDSARLVFASKVRSRMAKGEAKRVRLAEPSDLPWIVEQLNREYGHLELWTPWTADGYALALREMARCLGMPTAGANALPTGDRLQLWVVEGRGGGSPVASALYINMDSLVTTRIIAVHPALRAAAFLLRLPFVPNRSLRGAEIRHVVAAEGHERAAHQLVRHVIAAHREALDVIRVFPGSGHTVAQACRRLPGFQVPVRLFCNAVEPGSAPRDAYFER